jgi:hypothetical protein
MSSNPQCVEAYIFCCDDDGLLAISIDSSGRNLPAGVNTGRWRTMVDFPISERGIQDETANLIQQSIHCYGYHIWREDIVDNVRH